MTAQQSTIISGPPEVSIKLAELIALRGESRGFSLRPGQIRAAQSGGYLSRVRGRGMEFAEVRGYQPGDDVRIVVDIDGTICEDTWPAAWGGAYPEVIARLRARVTRNTTPVGPAVDRALRPTEEPAGVPRVPAADRIPA